MTNTFQPQQHKGSPRYRSRDSPGWGHEGTRKGQTHTQTQRSWGWVTGAAAAQKLSVFVIYSWIKKVGLLHSHKQRGRARGINLD